MKNNKYRYGWLLAAMVLIFVLAACQPAEPVYEGTDGEIAPTAETKADADENSDPEELVAVDVNDLIASEEMTEPIVWDDAITTAVACSILS